MNKSIDERFHSILIRLPISRGLLTECVAYRNVKVLVGDYDFRTGLSREDNKTLANEICTTNQFTCQTGVAIGRRVTHCIDRLQKCNRIIDCEDKSDETSCTENFNSRDQEFFDCPTGYVKCPDRKSCYRRYEQTCGMKKKIISYEICLLFFKMEFRIVWIIQMRKIVM